MRKDELERQEREGRRMRRQLAVLATAEHVSTTLEICPRFVVPDTNCFVDHLADLRQIALTGRDQVFYETEKPDFRLQSPEFPPKIRIFLFF